MSHTIIWSVKSSVALLMRSHAQSLLRQRNSVSTILRMRFISCIKMLQSGVFQPLHFSKLAHITRQVTEEMNLSHLELCLAFQLRILAGTLPEHKIYRVSDFTHISTSFSSPSHFFLKTRTVRTTPECYLQIQLFRLKFN